MAEHGTLDRAIAHHQAGRLAEAAKLYRRVLRTDPRQANALYLLGVIAHQTNDHAGAVALVRQALDLAPNQGPWHNLLGLSLLSLGREAEANASLARATALDPGPESYNSLGNLRKQQRRLNDAIAAYARAIGREPRYPDAHFNLGLALREKGDDVAAAASFRKALEIQPAHVDAKAALSQLHLESGNAHHARGALDDAIAAYHAALAVDPAMAVAWYAMGCAESAAKHYVAATTSFHRALDLQPAWPEAAHNFGQALFHLGQIEEALAMFRRAAAGGPIELPLSAIAVAIPGSPASDNQAVLVARREWADRCLPSAPARAPGARSPGGRLRVGYVSAFFHRHNWMKPVWGLINRHDRQQIAVHLFSDAAASAIAHGYRPQPGDRFTETGHLSNETMAEAIARAEIDILVDLNGYSTPRRLPVFAVRPAPVIAGWFNMFATTGMSCYDCLVGDAVVIPPEEERFYTEPIARVPGSYLTFAVDYPVPPVADPPSSRTDGFAFGCLAPQYKITPDVIAAWCRILHGVPGSTLLLKSTALAGAGERRFVHRLFARHDIPSDRVRLDGPSDHYRFLEAYDAVDVALDTFPYNGGTTTTEAIWQGVPVVTFWGDRWVSRTSASILRAGNLGDFVAADVDAYVAMAIGLAHAPLTEIRRTMRARLRDAPVCDTQSFAAHMETLYARLCASRQR